MAQDIKNEEVEEVQEEEVVETAEETTPEKSELDLANERADEFENKYLRAHAEMQNIQRRQKRFSLLWTTLRVHSQLKV